MPLVFALCPNHPKRARMNSHNHFTKLRSPRPVVAFTAMIWLAAGVLPHTAGALVPPADVECCQRKEFSSDRCIKFELSEAKCEKVYANWAEVYRKFTEFQRPTARADADVKAPAPVSLAPARIEARLYYQHTGTFSEVINDKTRFWNTIIGEGGAKEPSKTLRVDVVLTGAAGSFDPKATVTIYVANADTGKKLSQQSTETGVLSGTGEYHAMFLLQDSGCIPLKITARVTGSTVERSATVPFACGE
jgi:hypothetical protein